MTTTDDLGIPGIDDIESLGVDGSAVYRARQPLHNRTVTVKILDPFLEPLVPRRFDLRRKALHRFTQMPGVVPVYETGETASGATYLIMPYFRFGSLADQLVHGPMPWHRATELLLRTAEIVARAHDLGVALGDLKPSSILLADPSSPLVSVYGMATRRFDDGSPTYAAPEVQARSGLTPAADVYSLSLILAALLAGEPPNRGAPSPTFLSAVAAAAPARVVDAIHHGLDERGTNRFGTAQHLHRALSAAITGEDDDHLAGHHHVDLDNLLGPGRETILDTGNGPHDADGSPIEVVLGSAAAGPPALGTTAVATAIGREAATISADPRQPFPWAELPPTSPVAENLNPSSDGPTSDADGPERHQDEGSPAVPPLPPLRSGTNGLANPPGPTIPDGGRGHARAPFHPEPPAVPGRTAPPNATGQHPIVDPSSVPGDQLPFTSYGRQHTSSAPHAGLSRVSEGLQSVLHAGRRSAAGLLAVVGFAIVFGVVLLLVARDFRGSSADLSNPGTTTSTTASPPAAPLAAAPTSAAPRLTEPPSTQLTTTSREQIVTTTSTDPTATTTAPDTTGTSGSTTTTRGTTTTTEPSTTTTRGTTTTTEPSTTTTEADDDVVTRPPSTTTGADDDVVTRGLTNPLIQDAGVTRVRATSARVTFASPSCVTASFRYGPIGGATDVVGGGARCSQAHTLLLGTVTAALDPGTTYVVAITATDADGRTVTSTVTFTTLG